MEFTLIDILFGFELTSHYNNALTEELTFLCIGLVCVLVRFIVQMIRIDHLTSHSIDAYKSFFKSVIFIFLNIVWILHMLNLKSAYQWNSFMLDAMLASLYNELIGLSTACYEMIAIVIFYRITSWLLYLRLNRSLRTIQ